jgi:hypothetical protein
MVATAADMVEKWGIAELRAYCVRSTSNMNCKTTQK